MKTTSTILLLIILALAGVIAMRMSQQANRNRSTIDALATQRTGLQAAAATVEKRLRTVSAGLAQVEQNTGQPPQEPSAGTGADESAATAGNNATTKPAKTAPRLSAMTIIANDLQMRAEYAQNFRTGLDLDYGGMFKALGFSAEQREKFKDLLVETMQQVVDLSMAAEMHGLDRNSAAFKKLQAEIYKSRSEKEAVLLGELEAPYREYTRAWSVRDRAKELAATAIHSGESMSFAQVERTTQILATNSQHTPNGYVKPNTVDWATASAQLQGVLSPAQIVTLGDILESSALQAKTTARHDRLLAEFKAKQAAK